MAKKDTINFDYIRTNTKVRFVKTGDAYCIAFRNESDKCYRGIAIDDWHVAKAISDYFKIMSKALKSDKATP